METRTRTQSKKTMSFSCILCSMSYSNNPRNKTNRPLQLCEKIQKNCIEYIDEDDLGDEFMKLDCKCQSLPLCSRCFVIAEKLSQLNDKLGEIRAEILDLVESFKLEFLKSREVMSIYNSKSTNASKRKARNRKSRNDDPVEVKEEIILDDVNEGSEPSEPFENDIQNDPYINTENFTDLLTLDVQENVVQTSNKRGLSDDEISDSESESENEISDHNSGKKWDSSDSSETSFSKPRKRKKKPGPRTPISHELYQKPDFTVKPEIADKFIYKGHVVGAELLVLTCNICQQDKRGGRGTLGNFRRHLRIKHGNNTTGEVTKKINPKTPIKIQNGKEILETRNVKLSPQISKYFKYKGHIPNTKNYLLTCNLCGQDRRGQASHNFLRHLKKTHSKQVGLPMPVTVVE